MMFSWLSVLIAVFEIYVNLVFLVSYFLSYALCSVNIKDFLSELDFTFFIFETVAPKNLLGWVAS